MRSISILLGSLGSGLSSLKGITRLATMST
jgi:hypothetical protein